MRWRRSALLFTAVSLAALRLPFADSGSISAQSGGDSISSTSGSVQWDFAPVVAGQVINAGVQDVCPPGICDNHDLTVVLPSPAATFYTTMTAKLTIQYTWNSTVPTDLDIFAISPTGADHGPGSPDDTSTGPGIETLTLTDPLDGVWHVRSMAALSPLPTSAHAVATRSEEHTSELQSPYPTLFRSDPIHVEQHGADRPRYLRHQSDGRRSWSGQSRRHVHRTRDRNADAHRPARRRVARPVDGRALAAADFGPCGGHEIGRAHV